MSEFLRRSGLLCRGLAAMFIFGMTQIPTPLRAQFRVEPPGWWAGMQDSTLQLMVHGEGAGVWQVSVDHPGVRLLATHRADSPSYLFLDLEIAAGAAPGAVELVFTHPRLPQQTVAYPLAPRSRPASDFINTRSLARVFG